MGPDVALQPDGKIVTAGTRGSETGDFALARSLSTAASITSFDGDGKVVTDFGSFEVAEGVAIQSDGKIVAAGGTPRTLPSPATTRTEAWTRHSTARAKW